MVNMLQLVDESPQRYSIDDTEFLFLHMTSYILSFFFDCSEMPVTDHFHRMFWNL